MEEEGMSEYQRLNDDLDKIYKKYNLKDVIFFAYKKERLKSNFDMVYHYPYIKTNNSLDLWTSFCIAVNNSHWLDKESFVAFQIARNTILEKEFTEYSNIFFN